MVLNSVKYCGELPEFLITTQPFENGILLILADNGRGIPGEDLPRIFDKGFTGSNGRAGEGATGMGLYLCRRLCEKLGVGIRAQSVVSYKIVLLLNQKIKPAKLMGFRVYVDTFDFVVPESSLVLLIQPFIGSLPVAGECIEKRLAGPFVRALCQVFQFPDLF